MNTCINCLNLRKKIYLEKDKNGEYKNQIYSVFNASKNPIIERFNKTLTNKLWKQFTIQGNQKWLKILPGIVKKYNNTIHKTINTTPSLASTDPSLVNVKIDLPDSNEKPKFKIGDRVRIFKYKNRFEKGYRGYWTKEIFKIKEILKTDPIMYKIVDLDNELNSWIILCKRTSAKLVLKELVEALCYATRRSRFFETSVS